MWAAVILVKSDSSISLQVKCKCFKIVLFTHKHSNMSLLQLLQEQRSKFIEKPFMDQYSVSLTHQQSPASATVNSASGFEDHPDFENLNTS